MNQLVKKQLILRELTHTLRKPSVKRFRNIRAEFLFRQMDHPLLRQFRAGHEPDPKKICQSKNRLKGMLLCRKTAVLYQYMFFKKITFVDRIHLINSSSTLHAYALRDLKTARALLTDSTIYEIQKK